MKIKSVFVSLWITLVCVGMGHGLWLAWMTPVQPGGWLVLFGLAPAL